MKHQIKIIKSNENTVWIRVRPGYSILQYTNEIAYFAKNLYQNIVLVHNDDEFVLKHEITSKKLTKIIKNKYGIED